MILGDSDDAAPDITGDSENDGHGIKEIIEELRSKTPVTSGMVVVAGKLQTKKKISRGKTIKGSITRKSRIYHQAS